MSEQNENYENMGLCNYCAHPLPEGEDEYHKDCKVSKLREQRVREDPQ
jgi:hypothetical protein